MAALASSTRSLRRLYIKNADFCFLFNVMFFPCLMVYMLFVDSSVQLRWWYNLFSGYFERFGLMTVLLVFFFIVYDATDCSKYFLTEWLGIHRVAAAEISKVEFFLFVCIS